MHVGKEPQVFCDGQVGIQAVLLRHVAQPLADPVRILVYTQALQGGMPLVGIEHPHQQSKCGRLARAVRADQAEDLPGLHVQVDPGHGGNIPEPLVQATGLEQCHDYSSTNQASTGMPVLRIPSGFGTRTLTR